MDDNCFFSSKDEKTAKRLKEHIVKVRKVAEDELIVLALLNFIFPLNEKIVKRLGQHIHINVKRNWS